MEEILCDKDHGPRHGTYRCMTHMAIEGYRYGIMTGWMTFDQYDLYLKYKTPIQRMASKMIVSNT